MELSQEQCADALARLGLPLTQEPGVITVQPPSHRFDLRIEEDLIEEVARIVGYDNLPETAPLAPIVPSVSSESRKGRFALRHQLAGRGYLETVNFSFVPPEWENDLAGNADPIKLLNPIVSQMSVMRSSLVGSLLQVLKFNVDRRADRVRVFEIGRVFRRDASVQTTDATVAGVDQPMRVAGLAYGAVEPLSWRGKQPAVDFFDVKADVEALLAPRQAVFAPAEHPAMHPGRCASVSVDGQLVGHVGELHPKWRQQWELPQTPVLFELDLDAVLPQPLPQGQALPRQLPVERDLALIVPEAVTHAQLMQAVQSVKSEAGVQVLQSAMLFDVYRPKPGQPSAGLAEGEKSLAVRLTLGKGDEAMTDADIDAAMQAVASAVAGQLGGRLRA
jgi:phenylalanyl-tRNA synthetase beta chain